jgi:RNA polymerase sigma-70 factor (ECF subfamily)
MTETRTKPSLEELEQALEQHRLELTGYCYRMLGSAFESEDAVQDTLFRAWRAFDRFDGRSSVRTWLYKIATNVCIDMLNSRNRRALPIDLSPATSADAPLAEKVTESTWIEPIPDGRVIPTSSDPAEVVELRESIRLAFVATVQHLPPKQRSVLILREVLRWSASEVAELLDTTVASVNSALQRARATMDASDLNSHRRLEPMDEAQNVLLTRYVDAFERYDIDSFVSLLHEDATHAMPPYPMWLQGPAEVHKWMIGPGAACEGSRLVPAQANGCPAFGQYRPSGPGGRHEPWALHVVEISHGAITGITYFLDTERLFPLFGLPQHPDD